MDKFFELMDTYGLPVVILAVVIGMCVGFAKMVEVYAGLLA